MIFSGHYIPKKPEYKFFSSAHGIFPRIDYILWAKTNLDKIKSVEIISSIFSDHNVMKLEINHRKRNEIKLTIWRQNNMLPKKRSMKKSKKKLNNTLRQMTMKTKTYKNYGMTQKQFLVGSS